MAGFNYDSYLKISDEIKLNKLASEADIMLIFNKKQMDKYDRDMCEDKLKLLEDLSLEFMGLISRAAFHNNKTVYDMCDVYIVDITYQMNELAKRIDKLDE